MRVFALNSSPRTGGVNKTELRLKQHVLGMIEADADLEVEVEKIKDKTDSLTWGAIDTVRRVGNLVAHVEKDVNLIVDVDPNEAQLLIGLIETLVKDWYFAREEREPTHRHPVNGKAKNRVESLTGR